MFIPFISLFILSVFISTNASISHQNMESNSMISVAPFTNFRYNSHKSRYLSNFQESLRKSIESQQSPDTSIGSISSSLSTSNILPESKLSCRLITLDSQFMHHRRFQIPSNNASTSISIYCLFNSFKKDLQNRRRLSSHVPIFPNKIFRYYSPDAKDQHIFSHFLANISETLPSIFTMYCPKATFLDTHFKFRNDKNLIGCFMPMKSKQDKQSCKHCKQKDEKRRKNKKKYSKQSAKYTQKKRLKTIKNKFPNRIQKRHLRSHTKTALRHRKNDQLLFVKRSYHVGDINKSPIQESLKPNPQNTTIIRHVDSHYYTPVQDIEVEINTISNPGVFPREEVSNDYTLPYALTGCQHNESLVLCSPPSTEKKENLASSFDIQGYTTKTFNNESDHNTTCFVYTFNASHKETFGCGPNTHKNHSNSGMTFATLMASEWTRIVAYSLIFVVGVVGNVLVVVTLLHHRNLRTVTNVFLLNLAVSDLLLGVFCMPFTLVGSLLQDFVFGSLMCRLIPYMQAVSVSVSVWTLVAISLERFYAICQPLRSRRWQTPSHSYRVIALVWMLSLLFMMPIAILSTLMPVRGDPGRHKCREIWPNLSTERMFIIALTTTLLFVPLVVMAAAYIRVVRTLWLGVKVERSNGGLTATPKVQVSTVETLSGDPVRQADRKAFSSPCTRLSIRFRKVPALPAQGENADNHSPSLNESCSNSPQRLPMDSAQTSSLDLHQHPESPETRRPFSIKWWRSRDSSSSNDSQSWRTLRSSHTERSLISKRRVVRMLFVLVAEFFICWSPLFIVNLLSLYIPRQVYSALGSVGVSLIQLLAYISSCCNPITYCFMNAKFLQSFKQTFGCAHKRSNSFHSAHVHNSVNYNQVPLNVMLDRSAMQRRSQRQNLVHQVIAHD